MQCMIVLVALFIMFTIFPLRLWKETIPSVSNQVLAGSSDSVGEDYMLQRFIAQYDHLGTINLYLVDFKCGWNRDESVNSFIFRMLDSDMQILFEEIIDTRFIDIPGFCTVYINEDMEVGKDYYFFLQGMNGSRAWFGLEETALAGTPYVSRLIYNYDELEGYNIIGAGWYAAAGGSGGTVLQSDEKRQADYGGEGPADYRQCSDGGRCGVCGLEYKHTALFQRQSGG